MLSRIISLAAVLIMGAAVSYATDWPAVTEQQDALIERQAVIEHNDRAVMDWHGAMHEGRILAMPPALLPVPNVPVRLERPALPPRAR
jgi:hypothetical protein